MNVHVAKALPKTIPWFIALPFLAFMLEKVSTVIANGPNSSTDAVAYPFVIMGAALLWVFGWIMGRAVTDTATLGGQLLRFEKDSSSLTVANARGNDQVVIALPALDVPFQVEVVPVHVAADQPPALAMTIIGSMRSSQAMLAIIDPAWRLVYQERLLRGGPIRSPTLQIRRDSVTGGDLLIVTKGATQRFYRVTAP